MTSEYLYKEEYGQGDPILCLHGLGANIFTWRYFIDSFSKNHKLILVDLKGFGKSAKPEDGRYSIHDHADAIYELILQNDWRRLTLVGNSYGGALALLLAGRLQESDQSRISKLVLIDAGAYKEYLPGYVKLMRTFLGKPIIFLMPARQAAKSVLEVFLLRQETKSPSNRSRLMRAQWSIRALAMHCSKQCDNASLPMLMNLLRNLKVSPYPHFYCGDDTIKLSR